MRPLLPDQKTPPTSSIIWLISWPPSRTLCFQWSICGIRGTCMHAVFVFSAQANYWLIKGATYSLLSLSSFWCSAKLCWTFFSAQNQISFCQSFNEYFYWTNTREKKKSVLGAKPCVCFLISLMHMYPLTTIATHDESNKFIFFFCSALGSVRRRSIAARKVVVSIQSGREETLRKRPFFLS